MKNLRFLLLLPIAFLANRVAAQSTPEDWILPVEATVQSNPAEIVLHWTADPHAKHFYISRQPMGAYDWAPLATVAGSDSEYTDKAVQVGIAYEYRIIDSTLNDSVYAVMGFLASGIEVPGVAQPGTVVLLVDSTYITVLKPEIDQLVSDLIGEGWQIIRHNFGRDAAVTDIQDSIENDFYNGPDNVRTVFVLGHVPVPYSGDLVPDGHVGEGGHQGAWPADVFYGSFETVWTDDVVDDTTAQDPRNWNVPGDGKFDQSAIEAPMDMEVGRVDLYGLPSFALSDTALLKQYLDRDHAFRYGQTVFPTRALINDNFGIIEEHGEDTTHVQSKVDTVLFDLPDNYDDPATDGWRNFPPLVGRSNVFNFKTIDSDAFSGASGWFGYMDTTKYLWAYGCGPGSWTTCGGVGITDSFVSAQSGALFYMVFGSYFGDWDRPDAFTKAPLGTNFALESCWAGRPYWYFHPLGMGQTFGYCARISQSDTGDFFWGVYNTHVISAADYMISPSMNGVHVALMGDPTLRMIYLSDPPTALSASQVGNTVKLTWNHPKITVPGYNVYRSDATGDTLLQINTSPVTVTQFTDDAPLADSNIYVVRAAELTTTPSGSWWNESGGVTQAIKVTSAGVAEAAAAPPILAVNLEGNFLDISIHTEAESPVRLSIVDAAGREICIVADAALAPGSYSYHQDVASFASGVYFVRMLTDDGVQTAKVLITR